MYLDVRGGHLWHLTAPSFPRLAELASNGFLRAPNGIAEPNPAPFPQVLRWHLMHYPYMQGDPDVFANICVIAPAITHLHFSYLGVRLSFVSDLQARLPEIIQHVYLKLESQIAASRVHGIFTIRLKELNLTDTRIVLLPESKADGAVGTCTMDDWEEGINGGDWCWSLRERV